MAIPAWLLMAANATGAKMPEWTEGLEQLPAIQGSSPSSRAAVKAAQTGVADIRTTPAGKAYKNLYNRDLPPVPTGNYWETAMGRESTQTNKNAESTKDENKSLERTVLKQEEIQRLIDNLNLFPLESSREQIAGMKDVDALKQYLAKSHEQAGPNLLPLMAYSDSQYGGNLAKYYTPPATNMDYAAAQAQLEKVLGAQRQNLSENDLKLADILLGNQSQVLQSTYKEEESNTGTKDSSKNESGYRPPSGGDKEDVGAEKLLKTKIAENIDSVQNFMANLEVFEKAYANYKKSAVLGRVFEDKKLASTYNNLIAVANRDELKLGALAGPDLAIIVKSTPDPQNLWAQGAGAVKKDSYFAAVDEILKNTRAKMKDGFTKHLDEAQIAYGDKSESAQRIVNKWGDIGRKYKIYGDSPSGINAPFSASAPNQDAEQKPAGSAKDRAKSLYNKNNKNK